MDITIVKNIAIEAGKRILEIYNSNDFNVELKGDDSPLTKADKVANNYIVEQLNHYFPEIPIISEEGKSIDYSIRKDWGTCWMVDPLDGTKEFIKRNGEFTVNIALINQHESVEGVIYVPVTKQLFYTKNGKSYLEEPNKPAKELNVNTFDINNKHLRLVCSRSHMSEDVRLYVEKFDSPELVSMGSSLKFMLVANNQADIYPRLAPTMEWDTAAAQAIVEAAGGSIIDQTTNLPMQYNKENLLNNYFICFGNALNG